MRDRVALLGPTAALAPAAEHAPPDVLIGVVAVIVAHEEDVARSGERGLEGAEDTFPVRFPIHVPEHTSRRRRVR